MSEHERQFPRLASENTILVVYAGDEALDEFARTHTLGLGGCGFVCECDLGGQDSMIELMVCVRPRAFKAIARVAYQAARDDGTYEIGVEFLGLGDEERRVIEALFHTTLPEVD